MIKASIFEAKTNLSSLLQRALKGESVVITAGRDKIPIARLEPVLPVIPKRFGARLTPGFTLTPAFFEPLDEEELRLWSGEVD